MSDLPSGLPAGVIGNISQLVPTKTDAQIAADLKERMLIAIGPVIDIINEARQRHDMIVGFQIGPPDGFKRSSLALLEISKTLC